MIPSSILKGKALVFANIKGGVGKTTLSMYLLDYLMQARPKLDLMLLDTDPQATSSAIADSMLDPILDSKQIRSIPLSAQYNGTALARANGIIHEHLTYKNKLLMVDTPASEVNTIWQILALAHAVIVPTSLSWPDLRSTASYVREIQERKADHNILTPHIIVVPNRISPNQKDYALLNDSLQGLNVVVSPPICDYALVKHSVREFGGMSDIQGTRFCAQIEKLGKFISDHVLTDTLDRVFSSSDASAAFARQPNGENAKWVAP